MVEVKSALPLFLSYENRAPKVSVLSRISNAVFGSPRFSAANGFRVLRHEGLDRSSKHGRASERKLGKQAPIYGIDRAGTSRNERLPRIWLSDLQKDADASATRSRRYSVSYPKGVDHGGCIAFDLGERCFSEGISSKDAYAKRKLFQAAEILFLHAALRGNVNALVKLGVIYRFDMCAGRYWKEAACSCAKHPADQVELKAYRAFSRAAARGSAEAKWNLGDLLKDGIGCSMNKPLAFGLYCGSFRKAVGCSKDEVLGFPSLQQDGTLQLKSIPSVQDASCAALRIAECYEFGIGCEAELRTALAWYSIAERFANASVERGCWYFEKELASAGIGAKRVLRKAS